MFPDARWVPVSRPGLPGGTVTVYRWANRAASEQHALIGNVDGVQYLTTTGALIEALSGGPMADLLSKVRKLGDAAPRPPAGV